MLKFILFGRVNLFFFWKLTKREKARGEMTSLNHVIYVTDLAITGLTKCNKKTFGEGNIIYK